MDKCVSYGIIDENKKIIYIDTYVYNNKEKEDYPTTNRLLSVTVDFMTDEKNEYLIDYCNYMYGNKNCDAIIFLRSDNYWQAEACTQQLREIVSPKYNRKGKDDIDY